MSVLKNKWLKKNLTQKNVGGVRRRVFPDWNELKIENEEKKNITSREILLKNFFRPILAEKYFWSFAGLGVGVNRAQVFRASSFLSTTFELELFSIVPFWAYGTKYFTNVQLGGSKV